MKMTKGLFWLGAIALALSVMVLAGCKGSGDSGSPGGGGGTGSFVGSWKADTTAVILTLTAGGTGSYVGQSVTWTASGTNITIVVGGVSAPGSLSGGKLMWGADSWTKQ